VSPVRYELGFYIPEDDILHSHRRENLSSYIDSTKLAATPTAEFHNPINFGSPLLSVHSCGSRSSGKQPSAGEPLVRH
jgi:hypothetical protein